LSFDLFSQCYMKTVIILDREDGKNLKP
jgi:hypothetical protein